DLAKPDPHHTPPATPPDIASLGLAPHMQRTRGPEGPQSGATRDVLPRDHGDDADPPPPRGPVRGDYFPGGARGGQRSGAGPGGASAVVRRRAAPVGAEPLDPAARVGMAPPACWKRGLLRLYGRGRRSAADDP